MRRVAIALVHYPVLDREGQIVTTAITNLDLHDIARSAHTYGVTDYFVVQPVAAQRELAERVQRHWVGGSGARRIPDRQPAMSLLRIVPTLDAVLGALDRPEIWTTSASGTTDLGFDAARERLASPGPPVLICFGTGWGLAPEVLDLAQRRLESIHSPRADGYNHLSVRAAAAIILDRLLGRS
jgi:hypothetical protein